MNIRRVAVCVAAASLVGILLAPADARAARKWIQIRSANFLLEGDAGERDIRDVARRLEEFRETLSQMMPKAVFDRTPTVVLVFPNERAYQPFMPRYEGKRVDVVGYFQLGRDVNYVTIVLGGEDPYPIVFHEFAHLFTQSNFTAAPLWFDEGMAEFYSSFTVSGNGKRATVGAPVGRHLALLQDHLLPLDQVLTAEHDSPLYNNSRDRDALYAESWALTHYLLAGAPTRRPQLLAFLRRLEAGAARKQAWEEAFGSSLAGLETELTSYVRQAAFTGFVVDFPASIASRINPRPQALTEADAEARLGDLLVHMNRMDEAETRLQNALRLDPNQVLAHLALGEMRLRQNTDAEGLKYLERATTIDPNSYEACAAYGLAVMRRTAAIPGPASIEAGRKAFARALELRPDSPEAMGGLAWALFLADQRLDEAQRLAERAAAADPLEPDHPLLLAQIHASRRDFAAARNLLGPLMASPRTDTRERARAVMIKVGEYEKATAAPPGTERVVGRRDPRATGESIATDTPPTGTPGYTLFLREVKEGEQRAFGSLERIDCTPGGILFHVKTGERTLRLSAAKLDRVKFITYRVDLKGNVGCGARTPADPVYATFRPAPATAGESKSDGEVVAIEFVPKDYVPGRQAPPLRR